MGRFIRNNIQSFKESKWNIFPKVHFSQDGDDIFLCNYFGKRKGFYIDIGAYHPFRFSNTAMLYYRGWNGINIEPREGSKTLFDLWRPRDTNLEIMVGSGNDVFYELRKDSAMNGRGNCGKKIQTHTLMQILKATLIKNQRINLLLIDTEGMDLEILKQNNWGIYRPEIVVVETNGIDQIMNEYMQSVGYMLIAMNLRNCVFKDEKK